MSDSFHRKVIRITAMDSPNVALGLLQQSRGEEPTGETILEGVLSWDEYCHRRLTWDPVRQCVGLDALFYEGAEILLFPVEWLNRANEIAKNLIGKPRRAKGGGLDPGEGEANTSWSVVDEKGIIELVSLKTMDTSVIVPYTIAFLKKHDLSPEKFLIDRGGGGKQIADTLRSKGYPVGTVAFGESLVPDLKRGITVFSDKVENREERYTYMSRRVEMYHQLSMLLDPYLNESGWGIPVEYINLRHELSVFPKQYDKEGRMSLPPKTKRDKDSKEKTLTEMIGHSPDEADSIVLACRAMIMKPSRNKAGAAK
jgi:hypothetical protein